MYGQPANSFPSAPKQYSADGPLRSWAARPGKKSMKQTWPLGPTTSCPELYLCSAVGDCYGQPGRTSPSGLTAVISIDVGASEVIPVATAET